MTLNATIGTGKGEQDFKAIMRVWGRGGGDIQLSKCDREWGKGRLGGASILSVKRN